MARSRDVIFSWTAIGVTMERYPVAGEVVRVYLSGVESMLVYGALFGPVIVVVAVIITYLNERNQAEIDFLRTVQEKLSLQHALREAEFQHLNEQIKPHFLFNTLNTIRNFVLVDRRQEAMQVVEALAVSFRYTLERSGSIVPLDGELTYLRSYLQIQKARFGSRLLVELTVDAFAGSCGIPYLALQTLVENAVEHGVERQINPTYILVRITRDHLNLFLTISDDGPGTAQPVDEDLIQAGDGHPLLAGVGLKNVRQRLKHQFGPQAGLHVRSRPGEGFAVTMRMPLVTLETDKAREGERNETESRHSGSR